MKRHMDTKHYNHLGLNSLTLPPPPSAPPQPPLQLTKQRQQEQQQTQFGGSALPFIFIHPFTMTISGPTSCGKTTLVKHILQRAQLLISPPPTRIIWLYKRWQPLYDELGQSVTPRIEFIQEIPLGLESDSFISTKDNNLIILDDLMSTAGKDPRVTELFTEGSHHRNLSVIAINQNLYFSKDPTQRRNSNYMIVFNNPVDR